MSGNAIFIFEKVITKQSQYQSQSQFHNFSFILLCRHDEYENLYKLGMVFVFNVEARDRRHAGDSHAALNSCNGDPSSWFRSHQCQSQEHDN